MISSSEIMLTMLLSHPKIYKYQLVLNALVILTSNFSTHLEITVVKLAISYH